MKEKRVVFFLCRFVLIFIHVCGISEENDSRPSSFRTFKTDTDQVEYDLNIRESKSLENFTNKISYDGSQLWRVNLKDGRNKIEINELIKYADIWNSNATSMDILVKSDSVNILKDLFRNRKNQYEIVMKNVQDAIEAENPPVLEKLQDIPGRKGHNVLTWKAYHRLSDIYNYLDYLASTHPNLCTVKTIGMSVENRPIKLLKISNRKPNNKAIWIDGGIHAREWISPASVTYIIENLVQNFEDLSPQLYNLDWYILPVGNPDGYEYSHMKDRLWRKNRRVVGRCVGVDLNRNFGHKWGGKGVSKNPCTDIYGGDRPFSEPETSAIKNFIESTKTNWRAYISFHSYGQYILYPWGYDKFVTPDHADLQGVASKVAAVMRFPYGSHYRYGSSATTLYPASGGSDDWAKGTKNIKYSYTIELRDNGRFGFILPASYIIPTAREALMAVEVIAAAANSI